MRKFKKNISLVLLIVLNFSLFNNFIYANDVIDGLVNNDLAEIRKVEVKERKTIDDLKTGEGSVGEKETIGDLETGEESVGEKETTDDLEIDEELLEEKETNSDLEIDEELTLDSVEEKDINSSLKFEKEDENIQYDNKFSTIEISEFTQLKDILEEDNSDELNLVLTNNIEVTENINVSSTYKKVSITGNSNSIIINEQIEGESAIFYIENNDIEFNFKDLEFNGNSISMIISVFKVRSQDNNRFKLVNDNVKYTNFKTNTGGVVVNSINTDVTVIGGEFINNSSYDNGTVLFIKTGKLELDSGKFILNETKKQGGAIQVYDGYGYIKNSIFENNKSIGGAGAVSIYFAGLKKEAKFTFENNKFISNESLLKNEEGGAIKITGFEEEATVEMFDNLFENNASNNGGAVFKKVCKLISNNNEFINNSASGNGGAIINYSGPVNISNSKFENNIAKENNGGAFSNIEKKDIIIIKDSEFISNEAGTEATSTFYGNGGAISNLYSVNGLKIDNCRFIKNKAKNSGGAISMQMRDKNNMITVKDSEFISNISKEQDGGAIFLNMCDLTLQGENIFNLNKAKSNGGAILADSVYIKQGKNIFDENQANIGGAIYSNKLFLDNGNKSTFKNNSAQTYGGAIYCIISENNLKISEGTIFENNKADSKYAMHPLHDYYKEPTIFSEISIYDNIVKTKSASKDDNNNLFSHVFNNYDIAKNNYLGLLFDSNVKKFNIDGFKIILSEDSLKNRNKEYKYFDDTYFNKIQMRGFTILDFYPDVKNLEELSDEEYFDLIDKTKKAAQKLLDSDRFLGWKIIGDKDYDILDNGENYTVSIMDNYVNAVAMWKLDKLNVIFNPNGGRFSDGSTANKIIQVEKDNLIDIEEVTKDNKEFLGWYLDQEYNNKWHFADDKVTEDIVLYAKWSENSIIEDKNPEDNNSEKDSSNYILPDKKIDKEKESFLDIDNIKHLSYIHGYGDNKFRPENNITRAETITIFYRLLKEEYKDEFDSKVNNFKDLTDKCWYNKAACTMNNIDVIRGYEDKTFRGNDMMTRAEFATILSRFFDREENFISQIIDIKGHWAEKYILKAVETGLIRGYEDGTYRPDENIKRCEVVSVINKILDREISDCILDLEVINYYDNEDQNKWYYLDIIEATNSHEHKHDRETKEQKDLKLLEDISLCHIQ